MKPIVFAAALLAAAPALAQHAGHDAATQVARAALADPARPTADRERDAARKPAELLAFAGIAPGMQVADFIMGGGYWTRILSNVVGPNGKVYAYQPAELIQHRAAYGAEQDEAVKGRANVVASRESLRTVAFPEPLDAVMTVQNWHDLHLSFAPAGFADTVARRIYDAMKPGGVLVIVDHQAAPGTGFAAADTLHRGDGAATRAEIEKAGFVFEAESPLYASPADPRTAIVFDPGIRGKTDQFVYRFRKPRA